MDFNEEAAINYQPDDTSMALESARVQAEQQFGHRDDVAGFGMTLTPDGDEAIVIYVKSREALGQLPHRIQGVAVIGEVTGEIWADTAQDEDHQ